MTTHRDLDITTIRQLYEERRFLDAFALTGDIWAHPERVARYDAEALVLGARLASKLGSGKIERALYRYLLKNFPQEPITRVYARGSASLHTSVYDYLRDFEEDPHLDTDDPRLNVYWLCQNAYLWTLVRGFERADTLLKQAEGFHYDVPWLLTTMAYLELSQDRWQQALDLVEQAWGLDTASKGFFTASILAQCLTRLGRADEAIERLDQSVEASQCFQLTTTVLWYLLTAAEYAEGDQQTRLLVRSHGIVNRLSQLVPLADRFVQQQIQAIRLDIAFLERDVEQMQASTAFLHSPYFHTIRENLRNNPHGKVYMGTYHPVWQKYNTCLPASMATVIQSTPPLDADELAAALTYGGTSSWRAISWLKDHGFAVKPFIFTAELGKRLLKQGMSFIFTTEGDDWGHATAAIGYDDAAGALIIHDPAQLRQTRMLMEKIEEFFGPFSPEALLVVAGDQTALLDLIPEAAARPLELYMEFWKIQQEQGWSETQAILDTLTHEFPEHLLTKRLCAIYFANTGKLGEALKIQEALLAQFPDSIQCRRDLLMTLKQTRDTARILQVYEDFVERNTLPVVTQDKSYPSGMYVVEYADYLSFTSSGYHNALTHLFRVLLREPINAAAYHSLGDILAYQGKHRESILPFSIAAHLKEEDDHYARAVCDACIQSGDPAAGFSYLERRIQRIGESPHAFGAWLTQVAALEDYGHPDQAIAVFQQAEHKFPNVPELMLFGVHFRIRMGQWGNALQLLDNLENKGHRLYFLEAASNFYYQRGAWERALTLAEEWWALKPGEIAAFRVYSFLYALKYGRLEKKALVERVVQQFKNDEAFEEVYVETLDELFLRDAKITFLRARVCRNDRDGWAWNELCHELLAKAELLSEETRQPILREVEEVLVQCRKLGEGTFALCCLLVRYKLCRGARREAIALLFEALERQPSHPFPYTAIMDEARMLPEPEREEILRRLEAKLFCTVNFLSHAVEFAGKIAAQHGLAKAVAHVSQWRQHRPDDPELALSLARLWLDYGQSRSDAEKAVALLEPLVQRFPNHFGLSLALADAYAILHRAEDQILAYRTILERDPLQTYVRWQLSRVLTISGRLEEAEKLLAEGCQITPLDASCWYNYTVFLESQQRYDQALDVLRQAVKKTPESIQLHEHLINRLLMHNLTAEARRYAQALLDFFPDGAYCWHLLADTLHRSPDYSDLHQIEAHYRHALALNAALFPAAEGLVRLMASQHRYREAHDILRNLPQECQVNPETVWLNAWIFRCEGKKEETYEEINTVLCDYPNYLRAWQFVMEWLEEDEDWEKARTMLTDIPPVLLSQPDFRARRLEVLQKAGIPLAELDAEWNELCREFPENFRLQLSRFDLLVEAKEWDRAEQVLNDYERFEPTSSYLLARKVQMLVHREQDDDAIATAVKIWTLPGDDEVWPEHFAWDILQEAGCQREAVQAALDALLSDKRLRLRVFMLLLQQLHLVKATLRTPWRERLRSIALLRTPTRIQIYLNLMTYLHHVTWDPAAHLSAVLSYLDEIKGHRPAVRHCLRHQDLYWTMTPVRQNAVMLMGRTRGEPYRKVIRAWLKDWRTLPGIQMWSVTNYLLAVAPRTDWFKITSAARHEQFETSRDCLHTLAFDHTARYMCALYCEAGLLMGKYAEFCEGIERYRGLLEDDKPEHWLPNHRKHLPQTMLLFFELDQAETPQAVWEISIRLRRHTQRVLCSWISPTWWTLTNNKLPLLKRVWWRICRIF